MSSTKPFKKKGGGGVEYLFFENFRWTFLSNIKLVHLTELVTDQMMMATSLMMASFRQSKKSLRAWPCSFMLPMTRPKHMEKTTRPRALTPSEEPGTGTVSSTVS